MRFLGLLAVLLSVSGCAAHAPVAAPREPGRNAEGRLGPPRHPTVQEQGGTPDAADPAEPAPPAPQAQPLQVLVVDLKGKPIPGALVGQDSPAGGWSLAGWSGADGRCVSRVKDEPRPRWVRVQPRYQTGNVTVPVPADPSSDPVRVVAGGPAAGAIDVSWFDPTDGYVAGMTVSVIPSAGTAKSMQWGVVGGRHRLGETFTGLAAGRWYVRLSPTWNSSHSSQLPREQPVDVVAGRTVKVQFPAQRGRMLIARLRLADGRPLPARPRDAWLGGTGGVKMTLSYGWPSGRESAVEPFAAALPDADPSSEERWDKLIDSVGTCSYSRVRFDETTLGARPDGEGRFVFHSAPAWPVRLRATCDGATLLETEVTARSEPYDFEVALPPPSLRVRTEHAKDVEHWRLSLWHDGRLIAEQSSRKRDLVLRGLPTGRCVAVVRGGESGMQLSWHAVEIGEAPVEIVPDLRRRAWIKLRALDDAGRVLNARDWTPVIRWRGTERVPFSRHLTSRGFYDGYRGISVPRGEEFELVVTAPGCAPVTRTLTLTERRTDLPDVRLARTR